MPRLIPESPTFQTASEREVWERLRDSLAADDVLIANLRLTDVDKDVEADLVVLMPEVGILVLEVKGGSVTVQPDETGHSWWIRRQGKDVRIDPVEQVQGSINGEIRSAQDEEREAARPEVRMFVILLDDYHVRRGNDMAVRKPLTDFTLRALASVADSIALAIQRKRSEEDFHAAQQRLQHLVASSPAFIRCTNSSCRNAAPQVNTSTAA